MLFPSPSGTFHDIISRRKNEKFRRHRSPQEEAEFIAKLYGSEPPAEDWKLGWGWGWRFKPCKTTVGDDEKKKQKTMVADDDMKVDPPCKNPKPQKVEKGKKLKGGFRRFLSNNGLTNHLVRFQKGCCQEKVDFDSLTGKQFLICCFQVPMFSDSYVADRCRAVIETYDHSRPFELVVVVKMRTDVANYDQKSAFDHFCSAFSSCFAVPFSDLETRDYISSCFSSNVFMGLENAILVDPNGLILEDKDTLNNFLQYGSEWSPPFLNSALEEIDEKDHVLRCRFDPIYASRYVESDNMDRSCLSLYRDILLCDPDRTLRRFESSDVGPASTVLDLSKKYVGLYLCFDGRIIEEIKAVHDYCLANEQQLEIVLVCMSLFEEPDAYYEYLYQMLRLFDVKSWFLFDYDGNVCRRLWRVFGFGSNLHQVAEKLIIVPPNCESGELLGREVITYNGITAYPFTRSAILKQRLEVLKSLTPLHLSLFKTGLSQKGEEFDSELLRGKKLILYLDALGSRAGMYNKLLMEHYPKMKAMGWEVVYVPLDVVTYTDHYVNRRMEEWDVFRHHFRAGSEIEKMPWPVLSPSAAVEASVKEIMDFPIVDGEQDSRLVAVGKDGNIVARGVEQRLERGGVIESLFDDVLESDLAFELSLIPIIEDIGHI